MAGYADLFRYRELFGNLFRRDLQAKYKGSILGVAWSLVNPLVLLGIYLLVFSLLWKAIPVDHPALFLLSGLAIWIFFSTSIHAASRSMLDNASLIRKTRFPRQLVPLSVVATNLVSFGVRSEEHTSELQSLRHLVCRLLLEKKKSRLLMLCLRTPLY